MIGWENAARDRAFDAWQAKVERRKRLLRRLRWASLLAFTVGIVLEADNLNPAHVSARSAVIDFGDVLMGLGFLVFLATLLAMVRHPPGGAVSADFERSAVGTRNRTLTTLRANVGIFKEKVPSPGTSTGVDEGARWEPPEPVTPPDWRPPEAKPGS